MTALVWRAFVILGLFAAISTTFLVAIASADFGGRVNDTGNGIVVSNDIYNNAGGGGSPQYEYSVDRLPENNCTPEDALFGGCVEGSVTSCALGKPVGPEYDWAPASVQRRLTGSQVWETLPRQCLNFAVIAPTVTPEMAREQFLQLLPALEFAIQPAGQSFVNVPVIVYADQAQEWTFPPVTLLGQAVTIRAAIAAYTWSFGGAELTSDWPGRPFADDCPRLPCDGYVQYPFSEPGTYPIALTVAWTGEFSVNGGAWQQVPGLGSTASPAQNITVLEARPVLTDPYD